MKRLFAIILCLISIASAIMADEKVDSLKYYRKQADTAILKNKKDKASSYYAKTLRLYKEIYRDVSEDTAYAEIASIYANLCYQSGNYEAAIEVLTEASQIYKSVFGKSHPHYLNAMEELAHFYRSYGVYYSDHFNYGERIRLVNEAMKIIKSTFNIEHFDYIFTLELLSSLYSLSGNTQEAICLRKEALEIRKIVSGAKNTEFAASLSHLAEDYYKEGDISEAIRLMTEALNIQKLFLENNPSSYTLIVNKLALYYSEQGDYKKTLHLLTESVDISKKIFGEDHPNYAETLVDLADYYRMLGNYNNAISLATDANSIFLKDLDKYRTDYVYSLMIMASCYSGLWEEGKALQLVSNAIDIYRETFDERDLLYAHLLLYQANLHHFFKNVDEAIRLATKAIDIQKQFLGDNNLEYASSLNRLASYYSSIEKYDEAIPLLRKAMAITADKDQYQYSDLLNTLTDIYEKKGNIDEAIQLLKESQQLLRKYVCNNEDQYGLLLYTGTLIRLASCYKSKEEYNEAVQLDTEALEITYQLYGKNNPFYAEGLNDLAFDYYNLGQNERAISLIREYLPMVRYFLLNSFIGLTSNERFMFWNRFSIDLETNIPLLIIHSDTPHSASLLFDNTALFAKNLLLSTELEMTKLIQESGDAEAQLMYSEYRENRQLLNHQYSKPIKERNINCDSLERVSSTLERQLVSRVKEFGDYTRNLSITWRDVQNKLDDNDIAIEFLCYPELDGTIVYAALSLCKNDTTPVLTQLFVETQLLSSKSIEETYQTALTDALVWGGLSSRLEGKSRVYFSASGMLHNIGVEYLPSMEGKDCHRLSSTRELVTHKPSPTLGSSTTATLYGYIDYNATYSSIDSITANSAYYSSSPLNIDLAQSSEQSLSEVNDSIATNDDNNLPAIIDSQSSLDNDILLPSVNQNRGGFDYRSLRYEVDSLPGSRVEVQTISTLLDSIDVAYVRLMTNQASEESFKALSGQRKSLIHISTHGFYYDQEEAENKAEHMRRMLLGDDRPTHVEDQSLLRCGLCFAGANQTFKGESQPSDGQDDGVLNALEIAQTDLRGLDLVVLSACQTALGDVVQGEGVFGLQRGFKKAGAQSIMMSLWDVDDEVTQQLMTEFYRGWTSGMTKTVALRNAQAIVKEKYPDPHDWAAFILLDALD